MTIDYKIDENDFLTHQLFVASKSDRIKKKRQRNKVILPLIYIAFGLLFLYQDKVLLAIIFFIIGLLWFLIYPIWERRHYIKHYKGFIKENYKDRLGRTATLEFNNEYILAKDNGSQSKVLTTELEEICEIPSTIFVRLKGGQSFILPKDKITDFDKVKAKLKELADHLKIKYDTDEKWEWK
ncbi:MAG: YcxB family protein [Lunatimonas sp.]|uniref:YcxB family protein n=1 Tax=Lunatimonas sp. TaxID=2060141 RepID=UPI00263B2112|nr:YcxB family protein [Lunatimonas sp.]MCC5936232.1 YcxB family protein [Lunatimonas sp.]